MGVGGIGWSDERMESVYVEARAVAEAQNETMADIDTKAVQTVRFDVLLVGVLLTAAQITGTGSLAGAGVFRPTLLLIATLTLLASVVLGVITYDESDLYVGLDGHYVEVLASEGPRHERWDRDVVQTFAGMISENAEEIAWNSWLLTSTQSTLVLGGDPRCRGRGYLTVNDQGTAMSAESREMARENGLRSGKGRRLLSKVLGRVDQDDD